MKASFGKGRKIVISIIMPAYNMERFIEEAIRSVMRQTETQWELYVLDDHSTDATYEIAARLASEDPRIHLIRNSTNQGVARTRNHGFSLCSGNYVALMDSDDVWYPEKLERQMALMMEENADIVYCSYGIINESGGKQCRDFIVPPTTSFDKFLVSSVISCSTALLSPQIIRDYRFETSFYHEDCAFWLTLLRAEKKAVGLKDVLAKYRIVSNSRASNKIKVAINRWRIYRNYLKLPLGKSTVAIVRYTLAGFQKYRRVTDG